MITRKMPCVGKAFFYVIRMVMKVVCGGGNSICELNKGDDEENRGKHRRKEHGGG